MEQSHQDFVTLFYKMSSLLTNLTIRPLYRKFVKGIFFSVRYDDAANIMMY